MHKLLGGLRGSCPHRVAAILCRSGGIFFFSLTAGQRPSTKSYHFVVGVLCRVHQYCMAAKRTFVFLGAPGVGKGSFASIVGPKLVSHDIHLPSRTVLSDGARCASIFFAYPLNSYCTAVARLVGALLFGGGGSLYIL